MKRLQHRCISGQHYFLCHHLHSSFRLLQQLTVQNNKGHSRCSCQAPKSSLGRAQQPLSYKLHQVRAGSIISIPFLFFPFSTEKKNRRASYLGHRGLRTGSGSEADAASEKAPGAARGHAQQGSQRALPPHQTARRGAPHRAPIPEQGPTALSPRAVPTSNPFALEET